MRRRSPLVLLTLPLAGLLALLAVPRAVVAAEPPAVTLEGLLSSPLPSDLSAAPSGGRVAWVQNAEGARNLWVAEAPDYQGRTLTRYTGDDGQGLGDLVWSADGKTIYFVRGAGANRAGESPNPASDPAGAEQAIWKVSLDGGAPAKVGLGTEPVVAPDGSGLAFRRGGKVFWLPAERGKKGAKGKGAAPEPKVLIQTRGGSNSLRFSPDGKRLAFVSGRGDHSFVGVYDFAAKSVRWLAPSFDTDGEPVWSPDGRRLAFGRIAIFSKTTLFHPNREAPPWSILVAEVESGAVRTVFRADPGRGSVFQEIGEGAMPNQLLWGADDRIVFPWEKDGWLHLYSVPASVPAAGSAPPADELPKPVLLTPGDFEVEMAALSADGQRVVYSSNQGHLERLHLWQAEIGGGAPPVALTEGEGIETTGTPTADGKAIAFFRSSGTTPLRAAIRVGTEIRDLAPGTIPDRFPAGRLVEPEGVTYQAADGLAVRGQLFLPPASAPAPPGGKRPAVIFTHGGSHRHMLLGFHHLGYYHRAYAFNQYLASRGFVVLSINYRSGIGYGFEFREAAAQGAEGGSEFNDLLGAGLYLRSRPDVDPSRIGLWGGSYGGYLTAMGLARASHLFAAGVDIHGVHDWNSGIRNFLPDYDPEPEEERLAFASSPLATLDTWRSPVLVIHGDDDRNVNFNETVRLIEELRRRKVEVEMLVLPDEIHSFLRQASWVAAYRAAAGFLERRLGAATPGAAPR